MPSNTQPKDLQIATFHLTDGIKTTTCYLSKSLIEHIADFVELGYWASRSEFVRAAIREKVIKTIEDNHMIQEWERIKNFNKSQNKKVVIPNDDPSYKIYKIVKRLE